MQFSEKDISKFIKALNFSAYKHRSQKRKSIEEIPYINHPLRVAEILWEEGDIRNMDIIIAGILHDTIEDTGTKAEEITALFGETVTGYVLEVTDDRSLSKEERKKMQIEHAANISFEAKQIKLADKIANIYDVGINPPNWTVERKKQYLEWADLVVSELKGANPKLEALFYKILEESKVILAID